MARLASAVFTALVLATLVAAAVFAPAAASPQPSPVCSVCGQTLHENVTATDATLEMEADGDVRWRVESEVADPTATEWRENRSAARERVEYRLSRSSRPPYDPVDLDVSVDGSSVVVEFVDRGAARERLGLLVLPYFHGEGFRSRHVVNADEFVVVAPDGHRVVNEPTGATVEGDRAVWTGVAATDGLYEEAMPDAAPEPGNTYVVAGAGATAPVRAALVVALEPLEPRLYGFYAAGTALAILLAAVGYAASRRTLDRRWLGAGAAVAVVPYAALVFVMHPIPSPGTLPGYAQRTLMLLLAVGAGLFGALASVAAALVRER